MAATHQRDEVPPVHPQEIEAAAAEVRRHEPAFTAAHRQACRDAGEVSRLARKVKSYEFRLKYEFWPLGAMIVLPFAVGALIFTLGLAFDLGIVTRILGIVLGVAITSLVCLNLFWTPPADEIRRQLPQLRMDLKTAQMISQQSASRLQHIERPYREAKQKYQQLKRVWAQYEERQRQLAFQRRREAERLERERLASLEYRREQLAHRDWKAMRGIPFEQFLIEVFEALQYQVETTKVAGDQGVDLIVKDGSRRIAIQVKGYNTSIGNAAVQQVHTGMTYYKCQCCSVITNSRFTRSAIELAGSVGCILIDEERMLDFIMGTFRL